MPAGELERVVCLTGALRLLSSNDISEHLARVNLRNRILPVRGTESSSTSIRNLIDCP
jgi:hypothetical protein